MNLLPGGPAGCHHAAVNFFENALVVGVTLAVIGLIVLGLAASKAAALLGMREDAPWWFSPRGGRTQGFVVAYLGVLVAVSAGVGLLVKTFLPEATALAWTLTWVTFVVLVGVSVTRAGRIGVGLATGGRATWDEPRESDRIEAVVAADDPDLIAARTDALEGRWLPAAQLLAATGDPEMRQMRIELLAEVAGRRRRWLDAWLRERPDDRDANAVQAAFAYQRAQEMVGVEPGERGRFVEALEDAEEAARDAARTSPDDPSPWVTLVSLAELQDVERVEFQARLSGALDRAPGLRQAFEAAVDYLENVSADSPESVLAYAENAAASSEPGRTTTLMPAYASFAHFLKLASVDPRAAERYMESDSTRATLRAASDRWLVDPSPVCRAWGHGLLAFCGWLAEDAELAGPHLVHTSEAVFPWPWGYAGEPSDVHARARAWARHRLADPTILDAAVAERDNR